MFEIKITGSTMSELASSALALAAQFQTTAAEETPAPKPQRRKPAATAEAPATSTPSQSSDPASVETDAEDADLARELNAPVEPMPETGKGVVDAGTGQPVAQSEPVKQMTMDEVRANAAKLAAKDTPLLGKLIKEAGGTKLSDVPKENLGTFAAAVLKALGE